MGKTKETEPRYMEVYVPQEVMREVAEVIGNSEIDTSILGIDDDDSENIIISFTYMPRDRDNMMAIIELVDDYNSGEEEEESEEN
jgi:hypothetical protein